MTSGDVLCVGELMALVVPEPMGALDAAQRVVLGSAGAEANVAAWLAALGTPSRWCGRVGADALGRRVLAELRGRGVDVRAVRIDPGAQTGVMFKDAEPGGTRVWYYRTGSAGSRLDAADVQAAVDERLPRLVHICGVTPALSPSCRAATEALLRDPAVRVSFDVNHRPALWPDDDAAGTLLSLARGADIVFVGRDEAERLWGTGDAQDVRDMLPEVPTLVVKDGAIAATAFSNGNGEQVVRVAAPPVRVVEPVGAGDAFAAGYLHAALAGYPPVRCLRWGHLVAGYALASVHDVASAGLDPDALAEATRDEGQLWA